MRIAYAEVFSNLWLAGHRLAGYALLNLLDDPAMLALAFC